MRSFVYHAAETLFRLYEAVISPLMEHVGIVLQEDAESRCSPHTPFQPETAFISATICAATSPTRCRQPLLAPWLANNWPIMWFSAIGDNMTGDEHSQSVGFPDLSSASPLWWSMNRLRKTPILLRSASRLNLANGGSDPRGESWLKEKKKKRRRRKKEKKGRNARNSALSVH